MFTVAKSKAMANCEFDRLFTRSVPHILERIFFSLDHDSLKACQKVCKAWNELHSSEPYQQKAKELLEEKLHNEKMLFHFSTKGMALEVGNLLASGVNVNCIPKGMIMTPLCIAAMTGHNDVVKLLLEAGADPNREDTDGITSLYWPFTYGNTVMVKLLLNKGADPNKYGKFSHRETLLQLAASNGNIVMVKLLINAGANPNKCGWHGQTPLLVAASNGNTETVKTLLDAGADTNAVDTKGNTPLHNAVYRCWIYIDMVDMLLKAGADPNMKNKGGESPLDMTANKRDLTEVHLLLKARAETK